MCMEVHHLEPEQSGCNKEVATCTLYTGLTVQNTNLHESVTHNSHMYSVQFINIGNRNSPLGEGRHLEHLPQLHFHPLGTWERLFRVERLVSLVTPLPLLEGEEPPGLA